MTTTGKADFPAAEAAIRGSIIAGSIDAAARYWLAAFSESVVHRRAADLRGRYREASRAGRLRGGAVVVAAGAIGHLALVRLVPAQVAPATPPGVWMLVGAAGVFVALCAKRLAISWESSRLRRFGGAVATWGRRSDHN